MSRKIDATPRALTRTNHTKRIVVDLDQSTIVGVSVHREQITTDDTNAVVSRVAVPGLSLAASDWPAALNGVVNQLRSKADTEEASRPDPATLQE